MSHVFVSFAERTFAQPAPPLWEMSHAWSLIESQWGSLLTMNISFYTPGQSVAHFALLCKDIFVLLVCSAAHLHIFPRSFKQLIGGLDDVNNKQYDSDEVKAKWVHRYILGKCPSVCRGLCKSNFSRVYVFLPFSLWIKAWVNGNLTRSHPLTFLFTPPARLKTELTDRALVQTSTEVVLVVNDLRQQFHSCFTITGSLIRRSADIHKFGTWKHIHQAATSPNINRLKSQQPRIKADRMANETQKHKIYWSTYTNARTALKHSVKTNK